MKRMTPIAIVGTMLVWNASTLSAGVGSAMVKQAGKAVTKAVVGETLEAGSRATAKQIIKRVGSEAAESLSKKGATSAIAKGGLVDDAANAAWRNKGVIAGGAVLATAVANPKETIAAGASVLETGIAAGAEHVAGPMAMKVIGYTGIPWVVWPGLAALIACGIYGKYSARKHRTTRPKV